MMIKGIIASACFWAATAAWGLLGWISACAALAVWMWMTERRGC